MSLLQQVAENERAVRRAQCEQTRFKRKKAKMIRALIAWGTAVRMREIRNDAWLLECEVRDMWRDAGAAERSRRTTEMFNRSGCACSECCITAWVNEIRFPS